MNTAVFVLFVCLTIIKFSAESIKWLHIVA